VEGRLHLKRRQAGVLAEMRALTPASRVQAALAGGEPLSPIDWLRTLLATEIVFASDVVGSGIDWSSTTGLTDEHTIQVLRTVQRKIGAATTGARQSWP
jgi:hypothetical protein